MLDVAILGLLKDQPLHGYELRKRLGDTLGVLWGVSYGSLYPALRRLEREHAIEIDGPPSVPAAVPASGSLSGDLAAARLRAVAGRFAGPSRRIRKAYRITPTGEARFLELLLAEDPAADAEKSFALKLVFFGHLAPEARFALLGRRREALTGQLAQAHQLADAARDRRTRRERAPERRTRDRYTAALIEHRTRAVQRDLEWIDELVAIERDDVAHAGHVDDERRAVVPEGAPA